MTDDQEGGRVMTDTSTDAVESFIQGPLREAVLSEGMPTTPEDTQDVYTAVSLLRDLATERDALRAENERLQDTLKKIARTPDYRLPGPQEIARAALEEKSDDE